MDVLASWIDAYAPGARVSDEHPRLGRVHSVALDGDCLVNVVHQSGDRPRVMMFSSPGQMVDKPGDEYAGPTDWMEVDGSCWSVAIDPCDAAVLLRWSFDASTLDELEFHARLTRFADAHLAWADLLETAADSAAFDDAADSTNELHRSMHARLA